MKKQNQHPRYKELTELKAREKEIRREVNQLESEINKDLARDEKVEVMSAVKGWLDSGKNIRWHSSPYSGYESIRKTFECGTSRASFYARMAEYQGLWKITTMYLGDNYLRLNKDIVAPPEVSTKDEAKAWMETVVRERLEKAVKRTLG